MLQTKTRTEQKPLDVHYRCQLRGLEPAGCALGRGLSARAWVLLASLAGCLLGSWSWAGTKLVKWLEREEWEPPREAWVTRVHES